MTPYWVSIERGLGVGITAHSEEDARALFDAAFANSYIFVAIKAIKDMRDIEQNHVAPNMGNWFRRGIWYPLGFDQISN